MEEDQQPSSPRYNHYDPNLVIDQELYDYLTTTGEELGMYRYQIRQLCDNFNPPDSEYAVFIKQNSSGNGGMFRFIPAEPEFIDETPEQVDE